MFVSNTLAYFVALQVTALKSFKFVKSALKNKQFYLRNSAEWQKSQKISFCLRQIFVSSWWTPFFIQNIVCCTMARASSCYQIQNNCVYSLGYDLLCCSTNSGLFFEQKLKLGCNFRCCELESNCAYLSGCNLLRCSTNWGC